MLTSRDKSLVIHNKLSRVRPDISRTRVRSFGLTMGPQEKMNCQKGTPQIQRANPKQKKACIAPSLVALIFHLPILRTVPEAWQWWIWGQPGLHSESQDIQGSYTEKSNLEEDASSSVHTDWTSLQFRGQSVYFTLRCFPDPPWQRKAMLSAGEWTGSKSCGGSCSNFWGLKLILTTLQVWLLLLLLLLW